MTQPESRNGESLAQELWDCLPGEFTDSTMVPVPVNLIYRVRGELRAMNRATPAAQELALIDRLKKWAYTFPRKPAASAFTAGLERQIAYMIEDAEARSAPVSEIAPQWVKCDERLPLGNDSVFAAGRDLDGSWWREVCSAAWIRDNQTFATHWMPLPETPAHADRQGTDV